MSAHPVPASGWHPVSGPVVVQTPEQTLDRLADMIASRVGVPDGWLDTRRAAAYAGCSPTALHKATASRAVHFVQDAPGGKCWFKREWIDAWREGQPHASMPLPRSRKAA